MASAAAAAYHGKGVATREGLRRASPHGTDCPDRPERTTAVRHAPSTSREDRPVIALQRILFPADFSDSNREALKYACALAEKFGSELHLLHVLQDLVAMVPEPGLAFPAPGDYMQDLQKSAEKALLALPGDTWANPGPVVRATRVGAPFVEIVRYAKEHDVDLVVMGTHGRGGLAHVLLGSVAEKVVRKAPCPVLTVRPDGHQFVLP